VSLRHSDLSKREVHTAKQRLVDSLSSGLVLSPPLTFIGRAIFAYQS
jgi:hypothetical protein